MRRREFIALAGGAAVSVAAAPSAVVGQSDGKVPHIGYLTTGTPGGRNSTLDAFRSGLNALGYVEGQSIIIEYGYGGYREDTLVQLAQKFVAANVAVIVALAPPAARAAQAATTTIPIVIRATADPVGTGIVASLARPGGNITGVSSGTGALYGKRLELLKDLLPGLTRVAAMWNPDWPEADKYRAQVEAGAKALGLELVPFQVHDEEDLAPAVAAVAAAQIRALLPLRDPFMVSHTSRIALLTAQHRVSAISDNREFAVAGGLASYGASLPALHRRAAYFVDKILKGAKPADLPIEEPTIFELVINLKTAMALGLTIPQSILLRADEVIE